MKVGELQKILEGIQDKHAPVVILDKLLDQSYSLATCAQLVDGFYYGENFYSTEDYEEELQNRKALSFLTITFK